jgi:predicted transcriptional regulator
MHPLRKARVDAGLSVSELSRISGVSPKSIYSLEEGHRKGSVDAWRRLSSALAVPMDEIVGHVVVPLGEPALSRSNG